MLFSTTSSGRSRPSTASVRSVIAMSALLGAAALSRLPAQEVAAESSPSDQRTFAVADMHTDIILRAIDYGLDIGEESDWAQCTLPNLARGNVTDQVFAIWVNSRNTQGLEATQRALQMIDIFEEQRARHIDKMDLATSVAEAREIQASGRVATYLFIEGGAPIAEDLAILRTFHRLGVRGMTLTWMNNLPWAGSSTDKDAPTDGLSEFGSDLVREMNRLDMVVDLSHVSDETFFAALEISSDPVVVSHSNCRALADHPRNISDDMLRALAENGGVIGINALPSYLSTNWDAAWDAVSEANAVEIEALGEKHGFRTPEYREARRQLIQSKLPPEAVLTLDTYLDHIAHAVEVAGEDHVGLGSDFDGIWAFPVGLERPSKWPGVAGALMERGFSEETVAKIMGDNVRRVFEAVMDR